MSRVYLLFIFVGFILIGCSGGGTTPTGEQLTMQKCDQCHAHLITCSNLDKGKEYWKGTVRRMAAKDMDLDKEQESLIVGYLNNLSPGSGPVCN